MALQRNPTLVQAAMRIRAAEGRYVQAGLYPNPVIGYQGEEINDQGTAGQQGGFVSQRFVTAGKRRLGQSVAGHEVAGARRALDAQTGRVVNDVRAGYYEVLVAQRTIELDERLLHIGQEGVKAAEQLLAAMEVGRVDLLQARIEADSTMLRLHNAQTRHRAAWRRLAAVVGLPAMKPVRLVGDLEGEMPEFTWDEALQRLLAESPELAEARAGVRKARCALEWECAQRVPDIDVKTAVRYHNVTQNTVASVEVGLPLPIFNRNQGNISKAQAELVVAENEVRRIELALHHRMAQAFQKYADARRQVETYSAEILPTARETLDLVRVGYSQGEFDYLTLLTAQRTYFRSNLSYVESLRELRLGLVDIEGMLLRGGLDTERSN